MHTPQNSIQKPPNLQQEHLTFLDDLRESGAINMMGAAPYLQNKFLDLSRHDSRDILLYWMKNHE